MKNKFNWRKIFNVFMVLCGLWIIVTGVFIAANQIAFHPFTYGWITICFGICALCTGLSNR